VNEVLKQGQFVPLTLAEEAVVIYSVTQGLMDDVDVEKVAAFETGLRQYLLANNQDLAAKIEAEKELSEELDAEVRKMIETFKETMPY
jgi:F-type H+-transporting ATPase subunit alpha